MNSRTRSAHGSCAALMTETAGDLLCATRVAQGMTIAEAAAKAHLMPSHIIVLESYAFNPALETRQSSSYLASYSRMLGLNPRMVRNMIDHHAELQSGERDTAPGARLLTPTKLIAFAAAFVFSFELFNQASA